MTAKDRRDLREANDDAAAHINHAVHAARMAASDTRDGEHVRALDGINDAREELDDAERALERAISAKERAAAGTDEAATMHLAVEVEDHENGRRRGFVISGRERDLVDWAPTMPGFVGYCGAKSFREACERAMRMDNGEPGAYGPIRPEDCR